MRQIDIEVGRNEPIGINIHLKDNGPFLIREVGERMSRIPAVGRFVMSNIEAFAHSLGGDWDELPVTMDRVRRFIVHRGYSDAEVQNEVKQTLQQASGSFEAKRVLTRHIWELLVPMAA